MRIDRVDLNLFVIFDVIYRERNLTRAGEALSLTQPAVSNALNRLRAVFDDQLFVRNPRGMEPTPVADTIIGQVREALTLLDFSLNEGAQFDPARSEKTFRFSMNDLAQVMVLPSLLEQVYVQAPKLCISSYYVKRDDMVKALTSGQIDLAIDVPMLHDANLCHQALSSEDYVCVVRTDHPFKGKKLSFDNYLALDHLTVSSRRSGAGHVDSALSKLGFSRRVAVRVEHYMVAPSIIHHTDLAWTVPRSLARRLKLRFFELPFEISNLDWHLYWHKSADSDQANRWIRTQLLSFINTTAS